MSRLDSFIRRMSAQRDWLNWARDQIADLPGPVFELGLGNGRTYDHLLELFPDRDIYVFERQVLAHPDCIPPDDRLYLGDVDETLPRAQQELGPVCALMHADLGDGHYDRNVAFMAGITPRLVELMRPGGLVVSNLPIDAPGWTREPDLAGMPPDRYWVYRVRG